MFESHGGPEVLKVREVKRPEPSNNDVSKRWDLIDFHFDQTFPFALP